MVSSVMKEELKMRYNKITTVSTTANSEKNMVMRQQFGIRLIDLLVQKKVILNIDETWLGMSDFRRRKWRVRGSTNSVSKMMMQPRISMITGLDSTGKVYLSGLI